MKKTLMVVAVSVALVSGIAIGAYAQVGVTRPVQPPITVTGSDIGFRIESYSGDAVLGHIVVRVDGKWIDARPDGGLLTLASR